MLEYLLSQYLLLTIPASMVEGQAILVVGWCYPHQQVRTPCLLISCIRQIINLQAIFAL